MNKVKNKFIVSLIVFLSLLPFLSYIDNVFASSKIGAIDDVYKFAKIVNKNGDKINLKIFKGDTSVKITDTGITGFAYGNYIGLVNFSPDGWGVMNDGEGKLSGYATSEFGGWVNFSGVSINQDGEFNGYATSQNFGKIIFNCETDNSCASDDFKLKTDWRPISVRNDGTIKVSTPAFQNVPPTSLPKAVQSNTANNIITKNIATEQNTNETPKKIVFDINTKKVIIEQKIITPPTPEKVEVQYVKVEENNGISSLVKNKTNEIKKEATFVVNTPAIEISTKTIATAGVTGGGTVIISSLLNSFISFSEFILTLVRLWTVLLSALGLRKKRQSWGIIYDSVTKQPLDPVYVVLKDNFGKVIATSITDMEGRYGFMVKPGIYHIVANKNNYISPSVKLHGKKSDEVYDNLYFGETFNVGDEKVVNKNIPMDAEHFDWNEFTKRQNKMTGGYSIFGRIFAKISNILFYIGLIFSIGLLFIKPDIFNTVILFVYAFLLILRKVHRKVKSYGTILDKKTGQPIPFAIVRVFMQGVIGEKEMFHRASDQFGHYYCLLSKKGKYYITIDKKNEDGSYTNIYKSDILKTEKGILKEDFSI